MGLFNFGKKNPGDPAPAPAQPQAPTYSAAQYVMAGQNLRNQKRYGEAMECYRAAANTGDAEGLYWLANCALTGYGAQKDELLACELYSLASRKGHKQATETLFKYLDATIKDCSAKNDFVTLASYVKVGAQAGHIDSAYLYGFFLTVGGGNLPVNKQEGYKWIKLAADTGYTLAKEALAKYY